MIFFILHPALFLLILLGCLFVFWRKSTRNFWVCFLFGWGWQILFSIPAGIWQCILGWPHIDVSGSPIWLRFLVPVVGWPFNAGGYTVRQIFEATVGPLEWLVGHRSATVMSNMPYYLFLMAIQLSILAFIFALRYKKHRKLLDWLIIALAGLFLANSLANVKWFWAGT